MSFLLEGPERRELGRILLEAFDRNGLDRALEESATSRRLEEVVADRAFKKQVAELVAVAEEEGWLDELGDLLARERSERQDLVDPARAIIERAGQRAEATMPRRRRVALNLGLTAVVVALAVAYYMLHLRPMWERLGLFGAIVLAVGTILSGLLARLQKDTGRWFRQLLERRQATLGMTVAAVGLALLALGTSSLYLVPGTFDRGIDRVTVATDLGLGATFESADDRAVGRLFFFRLRPTPVGFVVEEPALHRLQGVLRPGLSLRRVLPAELERLEPRLLRILPGPSLLRRVPTPDVPSPLRPYSIEVEIGGRELEPADLRTHGLVVGSGETETRQALAAAGEMLNEPLERRLKDVGLGDEALRSMLEDWRGDPATLPIRTVAEIDPLAGVRVRIRDQSDAVVGCVRTTFEEVDGDTMKTLLVERSDDC